MVRIAHAVADENGKSYGGKAGDQTGKEVRVQNWYARSNGWTFVIRPNSAKIAEKIAKAAEAICANDNIGYNQYQRTTMWDCAKMLNWRFAKIAIKCDTDCSNMVSACVNAAGIPLSKNAYTGNLRQLMTDTGKFELHTLPRYLTKAFWLRRGDILLGVGHVCVILDDGAKIKKKLSYGDEGEEVRVLQEALNDLGYPCGKVDGEFGSRTKAAVDAFQTAHKLKVTSVVNKTMVREMGVVWG